MNNLNRCPCCDYFTLPPGQDYEICPICFWEDDQFGFEEPDRTSDANHGLTIREARANFQALGACSSTFVNRVISKAERGRYRHVARAVAP